MLTVTQSHSIHLCVRNRTKKIYHKMEKFTLGVLLCFLLSFLQSNALECYVCDDQEGNVEKCLNTIKTCEQGQDVCYSEIKWGSTPYWSQGAKKQYYISKRCSTKKECERVRRSNMNDCTHIWYQDWKCSECCQGDRCNYYIISEATRNSIRSPILPFVVVSYFFIMRSRSAL